MIYGVILAGGGREVMVIADPMPDGRTISEGGQFALDLRTGEMVDLFTGRPWIVVNATFGIAYATVRVGDSISYFLPT